MFKRKTGLYDLRPKLRELVTADPTALDGMRLPETVTLADFKAAALVQLGSLDTLFQTPEELKAYVPIWSAWKLPQWTRIESALTAEYDPIYNYSMHEVETPAAYTETVTPAETTNTVTPAETTMTTSPAETTKTVTPAETTNTETPAETTNTNTPAETTDTGTRENGIYGFNSSSAAVPSDTSDGSTVRTVQSPGTDVLTVQNPRTDALTVQHPATEALDVDTAGTEKLEVDTAGTVVHTTQTAGTESLDVDTAGTEKLEVDAAGTEVLTVQEPETRVFAPDEARDLVREGNIGVTTSQQMLESEIALRVKYSLMQIILDAFREDVCIPVW